MLAAAVCLLLIFVFPIWKITLEAPQYPKGLGMYIWINKIAGEESSTLQSVNNLLILFISSQIFNVSILISFQNSQTQS